MCIRDSLCANQGGKWNDRVSLWNQLRQNALISRVTKNEIELRFTTIPKKTPLLKHQTVENRDRITCREKPARKHRTDIAGAACNQNFFTAHFFDRCALS